MNESHEKKRSAALGYLSSRKLHICTRENYVPAAATDVKASINRARARMNLKQFRSVKA